MVKLNENWFVQKERYNGEKFWHLSDDAPAWLKQGVRDAHCGDLPDDWVYEQCAFAWYAICSDDALTDDTVGDHANSMVDVYTQELYQWAADFCHSNLYANSTETAEECGNVGGSISDQIARVQYFAIEEITRTMLGCIPEEYLESEAA